MKMVKGRSTGDLEALRKDGWRLARGKGDKASLEELLRSLEDTIEMLRLALKQIAGPSGKGAEQTYSCDITQRDNAGRLKSFVIKKVT